jgi:hypothetical protein
MKAVGYKVNYSQINRYPAIVSWVKQNDVKIIHLVRNNLFKRLVSHKIANIRNLCHSTRAVEPIKVRIDPKILKKDFRRRQIRFNKYRNRFIEVFDTFEGHAGVDERVDGKHQVGAFGDTSHEEVKA